MDVSWYRQFLARAVFAARARGGFIQSGSAGDDLVPTQERLYAGGANSVRGFRQNELGPIVYLLDNTQFTKTGLQNGDTIYVANPGTHASRTSPVGGNVLLVLNAEVRIRDPFFPALLEYVPFVDAGQVWTRQVAGKNLNREAPRGDAGPWTSGLLTDRPHPDERGVQSKQRPAGSGVFPDADRSEVVASTADLRDGAGRNTAAGEVCGQTAGAGYCRVSGDVRSGALAGFFSRFVLTLSIGTDF